MNINKLLWNINNIDVYSQKLENKKILSFQNNGKHLFSIIRNDELMSYLIKVLKKDRFLTFKKNIQKYEFLVKNYKLIFNCDSNNEISKKYFYKKIDKDYNSYAHTTVICHKKFTKNDIASQIFTKKGPLAFLPISEKQTSVVYSCIGDKNIELERFIRKHNLKYTITKINKVSCFKVNNKPLGDLVSKSIFDTLETSLLTAVGSKEPPLNRKSSSPRPLLILPSGIGVLM